MTLLALRYGLLSAVDAALAVPVGAALVVRTASREVAAFAAETAPGSLSSLQSIVGLALPIAVASFAGMQPSAAADRVASFAGMQPSAAVGLVHSSP